jgi:hypothetical protein
MIIELKLQIAKLEEDITRIKWIAGLANRVKKETERLELLKEELKGLESLGNRQYSNAEVEMVVVSGLNSGGGKDELSLAKEINMNYTSLLFFLQMRDWVQGNGKWVNTQERVIKILIKDEEDAQYFITLNKTHLDQWMESKKEVV